jgi:hypothetical protein
MKTASIHLFASRILKKPLTSILLTVLACFAFSPSARPAEPPPDGGDPNLINAAGGKNTAIAVLPKPVMRPKSRRPRGHMNKRLSKHLK